MKKLFYYFLAISLFFVLSASSSCEKSKTSDNNNTDEEINESEQNNPNPTPLNMNSLTAKQGEDILAIFNSSLNKKKPEKEVTQNIALDKIESYKNDVWALWERANSNFKEEKLITLEPIQNKKNSSFKIPSNLEPNAVFKYALGSQKGNGSTKYPLYIVLHGSGPKDTEWSNMQIFCSNFNIGEAAYFIPQIPNEGEYYRWWQKGKQYIYEKLFRQAFLLSNTYNPNRFYFTGYSEGAYGSQRLASFYSDYIAGAAPAAGGEPLDNAPVENCANIAFSLRTGANDNMFCRNGLTQTALEAFADLQKQYPGYYKNMFEIVPNAGHGINYNPSLEYLKDFSRNPHPKFVNWEIYAMDGIEREGFYNLVKPTNLAKKNKDLRTNVKMEITGNNITLKVSEVKVDVLKREPNWNLPIKSVKSYIPIEKGSIKLYLCNELVDLSKPVIITINGKEVFNKIVEPSLQSMVSSCALFYDPARVFPAQVELNW